MSSSITDPSFKEPMFEPPQLTPPEDPREVQEVLWERMRVQIGEGSGNWKNLTPGDRISREGFRPLISRTSAPNDPDAQESEAVLSAAERYQQELKAETARATEMLDHLDELEGRLHALHSNNDALEELSILLSYVRLEKAAVQAQAVGELELDQDNALLAQPGGSGTVNVPRRQPSQSVRKSSEGTSSGSDDPQEDDAQEGSASPIQGVSGMK